MRSNHCEIEGELVACEVLRYTPAGVPRMEMRLHHRSEQQEAGVCRQLQCEIPLLAFGDVAVAASRIAAGQRVRVQGFLAQRSQRIAQLVLHVNDIQLI